MPELRAATATGLKVGVLTLGCDKNTVDSERVLAGLQGSGVDVAARARDADVLVINTCGFIDLAKQESIDTILEAVRLKEEGELKAVVAMGCLVQRYKAELAAEIPEVDLFLGLAEVDRLVPELEARGLVEAREAPLMERPLRLVTSETPHTAHLKISEGCDHGCAFCAIPLMRGKFRSTPVEMLVREAQELEAAGAVELNIVSQDTTWYGRDWARRRPAAFGPDGGTGGVGDGETSSSFFVGRTFEGMAGLELFQAAEQAVARPGLTALAREPSGPVRTEHDLAGLDRTGALPQLLRALLDETGIPWIRLFYMYPSGITDGLVRMLAEEDRLLPYLDMPIQHGSDRMLKRMRRPERRETILDRVARLRDRVPGLALRTTVIVGFPGETDEDVDALIDLLETVRFDHMGAFAYSEEEGTPAVDMPDPVPEEVRRERLERVLDVQRSIAQERNEARLGHTVPVLVDAVDREAGMATGRAPWQAVEVDGVVALPAVRGVEPGRFVEVRLTSVAERDFEGDVETIDERDGTQP